MMRRRTFLPLAVAGVVLVALIAVYQFSAVPRTGKRVPWADFAVDLMPPGVTLTMMGNPVEIDGVSRLLPYQPGNAFAENATVLSDAKGLAYYTYDKDAEPSKPACASDCRKTWRAAVAPADAKPFGDWSIVPQDDGSKQWAYKNKPLYTFAKDEAPGDAKGNGVDSVWHTVIFEPGNAKAQDQDTVFKATLSTAIPFGLAVHPMGDVGGEVLTDEIGRAIYAFDGDPKQDKPSCGDNAECVANAWLPVGAPGLGGGIGDFTIVKRADGTGQWAYKGWPLYRYAGDTAPGESYGSGVDARWQVAVVVRYPSPAPVTIQATAMGKIFATADGRSLYRQYLYYYSAEAGNFEHGYPYREMVGRLVGARACVDDCTKTWLPFAAALDAQPCGHWSILTRPDGTRQWAYKGYALYTFAGDKKPGDLLGLDTWDVTPNDPVLHTVSMFNRLKIDAESVTGMFFTTAYP